MKRRDFIKQTALISSSVFLPNFLSSFASNLSLGNNRLIVIQLSGGNDGLNTLVPYRNDLYYQLRPSLGIQKSNLLTVDNEFGLNSSLENLAKFYESGELAIFNGVGYPNPNRSHFRSMDIWHSASNSDEYLNTGWIGRLLDHHCHNHQCMAIESSESLSLAVKGENNSGFALDSKSRLKKQLDNPLLNQLTPDQVIDNPTNEFLYKTLVTTMNQAEYIQTKLSKKRFEDPFPTQPLGRQLKTIAHTIASGLEANVYYASLSGFDTHINQQSSQTRLLKQVDESIGSLVTSLKKNNEWSNTTIFIFSEFGRRIKQNGSNGTDHGHGNVNFILSGGLKKAGLVNELPDLQNSLNGDIKMQVDFRNIYATLLEDWLGYDSLPILNREFAKLSVFK